MEFSSLKTFFPRTVGGCPGSTVEMRKDFAALTDDRQRAAHRRVRVMSNSLFSRLLANRVRSSAKRDGAILVPLKKGLNGLRATARGFMKMINRMAARTLPCRTPSFRRKCFESPKFAHARTQIYLTGRSSFIRQPCPTPLTGMGSLSCCYKLHWLID